MDIKENLLYMFENCETAISGEQLANKLNVSRNYIWKAVNALRDDGYIIDAVTNKGYYLSDKNTLFTSAGIEKHLKYNCKIQIYDSVTSTNTLAKQLADGGCDNKTVIIAREQSGGKGRLGRYFHSARGGLYMSVVLRPTLNITDTPLITVAAAVAVSRAVDKICGVSTGIKWVNDIFLNGKKICGILTQGTVNVENGSVDHVVLGIGLNINKPDDDFPKELKNIAASIYSTPINSRVQNKLIAEILNEFFAIYENMGSSDFLDEYRSRSIIIGKEVICVTEGGEFSATVKNIDNKAHLIVVDGFGKTHNLSSGEVRVKI